MFMRGAITFILCIIFSKTSESLLYPRDSETRIVKSLDGIWNFRLSPSINSGIGHYERWYLSELKDTGPTIPMVVPASYNDLTISKIIRDHVGLVWYDKTFFVPENWKLDKIWLRFGSVCYSAQVWVNGILVKSHEIGHLPFEAEITDYVKFGRKNLVTVAVDNTLLLTTVPQGILQEISLKNKTIIHQSYTFDFFNYAGIDRPVLLYTTPQIYIKDIIVIPNVLLQGTVTGKLTYKIEYSGVARSIMSCNVTLMDKTQNIVAVSSDFIGNLTVQSPNLWWPFLMHPDPGYLYEMKVEITDGRTFDIYTLKVGIRSIKWTNTQLYINGKPIYIRGVGKHEDSDIRGKGLDLALILKDFELMKWLGVNTFRTSHYPYAEEIMDLADEMGIMVIDECPSVDTYNFSLTLLEKHKDSLTELIKRDKNRPSVIMWSAANEPKSQAPQAEAYFGNIIKHVKSLDTTRPVTMAIARAYNEDQATNFLDIICFNRYNSWYSDTGLTDIIIPKVINEAQLWHERFNKPVMMCEYGADAYPGLHIYPESVWGEEYQAKVLQEHFKAFDELRRRKFFIGEMVWNFADFKTAQTYTRAGGNKKGMFTRQREPKTSAFLLRARYNELANQLDGAPLPHDLYPYTSSGKKFV